MSAQPDHLAVGVPQTCHGSGLLATAGHSAWSGTDRWRSIPQGLMQWQIAVRDDGQRLFHGCFPTFIQWQAATPRGPVRLHALT